MTSFRFEISILLLALSLGLLTACAKRSIPETIDAPKPPSKSERSITERSGGFGTQGDSPSGRGEFGTGEVTQETFLLIDLAHRKQFVRAFRLDEPTKEAVETFETLVSRGKIPTLKSGDRFIITRKDTNVVNAEGRASAFYRVTMTSGEHADKDGSLFVEHVRRN